MEGKEVREAGEIKGRGKDKAADEGGREEGEFQESSVAIKREVQERAKGKAISEGEGCGEQRGW